MHCLSILNPCTLKVCACLLNQSIILFWGARHITLGGTEVGEHPTTHPELRIGITIAKTVQYYISTQLLHLHLLRNWTSKIPGWTILERLKMSKFFMTDSGFNGSARSCTKFYSCASRHCSLGNGIHPEGVALTEVEAVVGSTTVIKVKKEPNKEWWPVVVYAGLRPGCCWAGRILLLPSAAHCWPVILRMAKRVKKSFQTINGQCLVHAAPIWTKIVPKIAPY